jgi:hypothetical protein
VISSNHLEPGAAGQIKATVDTSGKIGRLEKHITIYSNDRVMPALTLTLTLVIVQP